MDQSIEENDRNYLDKYISVSSPKFKMNNNPIAKQIKKFILMQENKFGEMLEGCSFLENCIATIQQMLQTIQVRINHLNQYKQTQTISNLKNKQNQFIINELRQKIKKHQKNQHNLEIQLKHIKKQIENLKRQSNNQTSSEIAKCKQEILQLTRNAQEKQYLIQQLNAKINKMVKQDTKKQANVQKSKIKQKQSDYRLLEMKLLELEKDFDVKITTLHLQLQEKNKKIFQLEEQIEIQRQKYQILQKQKTKIGNQLKRSNISQKSNQDSPTSHLTFTFHPTSPKTQSTSQYQLQLKLSQQQKLYKQLQTQYTNYLTSSNGVQIQLHQQIHQQKSLLQQQKKKIRNQKNKLTKDLHSLASFINKRNFNYFQSNEPGLLIQQIKKIYLKQRQKIQKQLNQFQSLEQEKKQKISQLQRQSRRNKSQLQLNKQQIQSLKGQIEKLIAQRQKEKYKAKKKQTSSVIIDTQMKNRTSLNGSFVQQKSNTNSKAQSINEEKYRQLVQSLRNQLKIKQQNILELENLQSLDFQKSKEKILAIESELADSKNQHKKVEREKKELLENIKDLNRELQSTKLSLTLLKQKSQKQKQSVKTAFQQKHKTLQQKLSKSKQQATIMQNKCQQKTMKYNKLKQKVQKLQLYNSQTQKRKDAQIQELIKKNQQLKMEFKIIQEKYNLLQLNNLSNSAQGNGSLHVKEESTGGYNKDLIEQIQMERDRILEQYQTKRRDYLKMKQLNEKAQQQKLIVQNQSEQKTTEIKKLIQKIVILQQQISSKNSRQLQYQNLLQQQQSKLQQKCKQLSRSIEQKTRISQELSKLKQQIASKSKQQYQHMKKQLQNQIVAKKKLQKQQSAFVQRIKQLKSQNQKLKKEQHDKEKSLTIKNKQLQSNLEHKLSQKLKQKSHSYHQQINKLKSQYQIKIKDLQQKLSQATIREQNLVSIINYKNVMTGDMRESMKGQEEFYNENHFNDNNDVNPNQAQSNSREIQQKDDRIVETEDCGCNTQQQQQKLNFVQKRYLSLIKLQPLSILYQKQQQNASLKELTTQKTQYLSIQQSVKQLEKQYSEKSTNSNIFQNQQALINYLKQSYPSLIQNIISLSVTTSNPPTITPINRNVDELTRTQPLIQTVQTGMNTSFNAFQSNKQQRNSKQSNNYSPIKKTQKQNKKQPLFILNDQLLGSYHEDGQQGKQSNNEELQKNIEYDNNIQSIDLQHQITHSNNPKTTTKFNPQNNKIQQINLFANLQKNSNENNLINQIQIGEPDIDDNFQICQQGQSINIGQTALNLQIKQIFNKLRQELQKVFNGQEISLSMVKILPRQLEDDYNDLISYIREKIQQIKKQSQPSFIMAELGYEAQQIQQQLDNELQNFMNKKVSQDVFTYKKLLQQKQALLTSLINQRTVQQNTINQMTMQKQQLDEQHENRFMNQCNIYKKEIKQLKNKVDGLEMGFQSVKNVFKNVMEIWVDDMENQDDLRDNFMIYKKMARISEAEATRLNYYIFRYRQIKHITDD